MFPPQSCASIRLLGSVISLLKENHERLNFLGADSNLLNESHMSATQPIYEQMLVVRSQIGDELAFEELLSLCGPLLFGFVSQRMQASPEIVEDLNQEIWIAIFNGLPRLRDPGKFRPWAFRIARDRIYREYRRRKIPVESIDADLDAMAESENADAFLDHEEILRGLDALSPEHRTVLVLCFLEEKSYEEISLLTGTSLGTVRSRIHYAKSALRTVLERKPNEPQRSNP